MPPLRNRPTPFPLLPLAAAGLLLVGVVQLGLWAKDFYQTANEPEPVVAPLTGNPFVDLSRIHPKITQNVLDTMQPRKVVLPPLPSNLQFGSRGARHSLTVMSDIACGACREQVSLMMRSLPAGVNVIFKYMPRNDEAMTAGMVLELARRHGLAADFWERLHDETGDLTEADLLQLLEKSGLPLNQQRAALLTDSDDILAALAPDINRGRALGKISLPVLALDGYLLDGLVLQPARLATYVQRLERNEPLVQASDYWLMTK